MAELGLARGEGAGSQVLDPKIRDLVRSKGVDSMISLRRVIKERVFKVLVELGYLAEIDHSTIITAPDGLEMAVFDLSVLRSAWSVSVAPDKILGTVREMMHGQQVDRSV